ncbi:MAG: hypothetical protein AB1631_15325 [Acidobacteriota bacterium]
MRELLHGTMLGDGYLEPHGRGIRLQVVHSASQKAYIEWKHKELAQLNPSPLYYYAKARYPFWRFVTRSHPYLAELRELFYVESKRVVPDTIMELLNSPQSLAVWFMDDGTLNRSSGAVAFETQSFSPGDIEKLQTCLQANFGIRSNPIKSGVGRGLILYVPVAEARKLSAIIEPHVISQMRYKLPKSL